MSLIKQCKVTIPNRNILRLYGVTEHDNTIPKCPICEKNSWYVSFNAITGRVSISCKNIKCSFWFHNLDSAEDRLAEITLWSHHELLLQQLDLLELRLKKLISFKTFKEACEWITLEGGKYWAMQRMLNA